MEGFEHSDDGIIYGVIDEIGEELLRLNIFGKKKLYKIRDYNIRDLNKGDKVRIIVKNGEVLYIEKLEDEVYSLLLDFFRKLKSKIYV